VPCYGPLTAFKPKAGVDDRRLVFRKDKSETGIALKVPCGRCAGCRLEHSRQWAMRCMHEKRLHRDSAFLTLTYDNKHLPSGGSLVKRDLQLFMKKYRRMAGTGIRFFACGEYGEKTARPHYHVLLLNSDLQDKQYAKMAGSFRLYFSKSLREIWDKGDHYIGEVTFDSCAYVARYCMKKITGPPAEAHYKGRQPEFIVMSRRPGIGAGYFERYGHEIYAHDSVIINGVATSPPRFYDLRYAATSGAASNHLDLLKVKRRRKCKNKSDSTSARLRVRELVAMAKLKLKARTI